MGDFAARNQEVRRRIDETNRKRDEIISLLTVKLAERLQEGTSGRIVVEVILDQGYARRYTVRDEVTREDDPEALERWRDDP